MILDGRRNVQDLEIPVIYPFDKTYPIIWPGHEIPVRCHLCRAQTKTHIEMFLTLCGWIWVMLFFITGLWCCSCAVCYLEIFNHTHHYCKNCMKHIGYRNNTGGACHTKQPIYDKKKLRGQTEEDNAEIAR